MTSPVNFPLWTVGRRKESVARVRVVPGSGQLLINHKTLNDYFGGHLFAKAEAQAPLQLVRSVASYDFHVAVEGGGISGQAGAIKLGLARALLELDPEQKKALKKEGFLKRDPRMVERKKPGQPKARRRFQHSKR